MVSLLGYSFWDYILCFFDYIPKIMYFLYAAFASLLDTMQCLVRRLAGLDVHYILSGNIAGFGQYEAVNSDPVLDFILGILGIGNNSGDYSILTTTFWSLAIFGLIVLALSTFVSIIKSHYNDDGAKTSPITYIYTAFKSILTFAIVPVVIIAGFWLSSFLLKTLDGITTSPGNDEKLQGIYGSNYSSVFRPSWFEGDESGSKCYSNYDFFGLGTASTSETFSGLIFKTAAHDANRLRTGSSTMGKFYDFGIFGKHIPNGQDTVEWTAYQIDYAFANNLHLQAGSITHPTVIYVNTPNVLSISNIDMFTMLNVVSTFSKYNVGLIWAYYNLWQFNFIIGFAAIITVFLLMISIILGLMTRIIKSIALFLIYPAILGIAPLDEWNGFKKWRGEFQQQVLMAFGAIVGMNLFFLIFPYLGNIAFFQVDILNYLVNIVVVITGLVMVKGFIGFMSSLIGGADAVAAGDGVKGEVGKTLQKGVGMTLGAANIAMKVGKFIPGVGVGIGAAQKGLRMAMAARNANKAMDAANTAQTNVNNADDLLYGDAAGYAEFNAGAAKDVLDTARQDYETRHDVSDIQNRARRKGKAQGLEGDALDSYVNNAVQEKMLNDSAFIEDYATRSGGINISEAKKTVDRNGYSESDWKVIQSRDANAAIAEEQTARAKQIRTSNYMDEDGNKLPHAARQMIANDARAAIGAFGKGLTNALSDMGIKGGGILKDTLSRITNGKYDENGKLTGTWGAPKTGMTEQDYADAKAKAPEKRAQFASSLAGLFLGYGNAGKKDAAKPTGDELGQKNLESSEKTNVKLDDLGKKLEKLTDAILKTKK